MYRSSVQPDEMSNAHVHLKGGGKLFAMFHLGGIGSGFYCEVQLSY
jgi:hypothetical protein